VKYLAGYPEPLKAQVRDLMANKRLGSWLLGKYPHAHDVRMEPEYHRYELDLRLYLTHLDAGGEPVWR